MAEPRLGSLGGGRDPRAGLRTNAALAAVSLFGVLLLRYPGEVVDGAVVGLALETAVISAGLVVVVLAGLLGRRSDPPAPALVPSALVLAAALAALVVLGVFGGAAGVVILEAAALVFTLLILRCLRAPRAGTSAAR